MHYQQLVKRNGRMPRKAFRGDYIKNAVEFIGPFDNCVCVPLTSGRHAIIDSDDFDSIRGVYWQFLDGYAVNTVRINGKRQKLSMHTLIAKRPDGYQVDHINGNRADNRKTNLRICTAQQNHFNRKPVNGKLKGVSLKGERWIAQIKINGKNHRIGSFNAPEEAALAYDMVAAENFGAFAYLNFPKENNHVQ